jgi:MYXO-CTERM domain-containing protein
MAGKGVERVSNLRSWVVIALAIGSIGLGASVARAGFGGQTILGPLSAGSAVGGNTIGHADDNDGFTSGDHFFNIWPGPDDAWQLDWPGGDLTVTMTYDNSVDDLDVFLFEPGSYDESANYAIANTGTDTIDAPNAAAGIYYINVDSDTTAHAGPYQLTISDVPEPGAAGVALFVAAAGIRRRRGR